MSSRSKCLARSDQESNQNAGREQEVIHSADFQTETSSG